ncbi:hypothetical protein [Denitrobaculum tricleocarpae]|uniref:Uncharacterized protein n=1 Tax=Denitrobaculum tricleocarpae TaxID=2591009 RepID=A0A545U268_9PROT|nr:hypothetical protein [Denitrobaculum tricleocarpae]TQV83575.1 hypothetical protein FKG95_03010 [Denitrobaculum tricleocarpae]
MSKIGKALQGALMSGAVAAALTAASAVTATASAQTISCGEREAILETLKERYHEGRTAFGITADGRLLEVFSGPSGSWTLLMTRPGGQSCLMSSGEGWRHIIEEKPEDPVA